MRGLISYNPDSTNVYGIELRIDRFERGQPHTEPTTADFLLAEEPQYPGLNRLPQPDTTRQESLRYSRCRVGMLPQPKAAVKQPSRTPVSAGYSRPAGTRIAVSPSTLAPDLKHHGELALPALAASTGLCQCQSQCH